jgi:hypothetical protein
MSKQDERGSTFLSHTDIELQIGGRYGAALPTTHVVGSTREPQYPQASAPFQRDPVPNEPALGYRVDELDDPAPGVQGQGPAEAAPPGHVAAADAGPPHSLGPFASPAVQATGPTVRANVGPFSFKRRKV